MRVAIITENFLPKLDGVTHTLVQLLKHLQQNNHQALLLGPESGMEHYAGAQVVGTAGLPVPFYPELKFNFFRPLFMRRLTEFNPDVVHLVDPVFLGAAGLAAVRWLNKPLVSSYHTNLAAYCTHFGFPLLEEPMWSYNRFLHNKCAMTFCPSLSTATILRERGFQRVRIWSRGVDTERFQPERRTQNLRASWLRGRKNPGQISVILYAGRISWEKNLKLLVQAYKGLDHSHCHLVMVGDGPAQSELQQELAGLPVTFTGYLSGTELAAAYASADLFAFPSRTETFGQVVLEAMASALPVVGLHSEGVCDLVLPGKTGSLLVTGKLNEAEQVRGYRAQLEALIHSPEMRITQGQAALVEARKRSWSEAMRNIVAGYQEVSSEGSELEAA
ncbi:MAG TPA: glycosyltransferase family 1 protein [Ktedonobacteraceae bacterium]|nr:glycosyltransferase family 1 protein [Ktedonobacteraceae bacterium]